MSAVKRYLLLVGLLAGCGSTHHTMTVTCTDRSTIVVPNRVDLDQPASELWAAGQVIDECLHRRHDP